MEERRKDELQHRVILTNREKMLVTGVEDVDSFDDDNMVIYTTEGTLTVRGADFRINRFSVDDGELEVEGEVDALEYSDGHKKEKVGLFSKIFK